MFQAILNVLAILVLAIVAGFIILLLVDLILGCIDGKRGIIFFKNRKNTSKDNEILLQYNKDANLNDSYYLQNNNQDLVLDFDKEFEQQQNAENNVENNIDMQKAEEEQKLIEAKTEENVVEEVEEENNEPETEVNDEFTFINKVSPELEKELEEEQRRLEHPEEFEDEDDDNDFPEFDEDDEDDDDDDRSIEEILNAIRERNRMARNKFVAEEDFEPDFDDEEEDLEEELEDTIEEKEVTEELAEVIVNNEDTKTEIDKLNEIIKELNAKIEAEQARNAEIEEKAKLEVENIKKEYEEKAKVETDEMPTESLEVLEAKLVDLQEREKQNDKDLKANKKEYIPLARIERTLENDQNKLRRKEAIVAKKKMVLFGVNNYVVDEEKEKKLKEDLDLLEGLKMSVAHCEEVMEANKDRYPVLKKANEILTRNAEQIEKDIQEVEAKIAKIKEANASDNAGDETGNDNN